MEPVMTKAILAIVLGVCVFFGAQTVSATKSGSVTFQKAIDRMAVVEDSLK